VGMSGSGKSTIENELVSSKLMDKFVTTTTRARREGEVEGESFFYVSEEKFKELDDEGKLTTNTFFNGQHYGMDNSELDKLKTNHCIAVVDVVGCNQLIESLGGKNVVSFYVEGNEEKRIEKLKERFASEMDKFHSRVEYDKIAFANARDIKDIIVLKNDYTVDSMIDMAKKIVQTIFFNSKEEGED
jgi:guanylate kinase